MWTRKAVKRYSVVKLTNMKVVDKLMLSTMMVNEMEAQSKWLNDEMNLQSGTLLTTQC